MTGLDVGWHIRQEVLKEAGVKLKPGERISHLRGRRFCTLGDRLYEKGRLGRKTGELTNVHNTGIFLKALVIFVVVVCLLKTVS